MKKILIAYADSSMKYSLKQLGIQAHYIKQIDKVILYTKNDLPKEILNSPLMNYKRGGGYWIWKPYLIWKTLQDFPENTKICYIDAGCSVFSGDEWNNYWDLLDVNDAILFQYEREISKWKEIFNCTSSETDCWTKKNTLDFFDRYLGTDEYHAFPQIWGGLIFCKKRNNAFIQEWLDLTLKFPNLILDPSTEELSNQHVRFNGNHRHDQSVLTPLAYKYQNNKVLILPELFDENRHSTVILANRNRVSKEMYRRIILKYHLQGTLGLNLYNRLKILYQSWFQCSKCR